MKQIIFLLGSSGLGVQKGNDVATVLLLLEPGEGHLRAPDENESATEAMQRATLRLT
jgi:hypothetical protein